MIYINSLVWVRVCIRQCVVLSTIYVHVTTDLLIIYIHSFTCTFKL